MKQVLKFYSIILFLFSFGLAFGQSSEVEIADSQGFSFWENSSRVLAIPLESELVLSEEKPASEIEFDTKILHVLKPYYGWYFDGLYVQEKAIAIEPLIREGSLYLEYWEKEVLSESVSFYKPKSNIRDILIIPEQKAKEVLAFIIFQEKVYPIRYWLTNETYDERKVSVKLTDDEADKKVGEESSEEAREENVFVDAYFAFGDLVYTSVQGKRSEVRNVHGYDFEEAISVGFFPKKYFDDEKYLVMSEPNFKKLLLDSEKSSLAMQKLEDLEKLIDEKNNRRKAPRPPLIKYQDLNFYYDEIERIRK